MDENYSINSFLNVCTVLEEVLTENVKYIYSKKEKFALQLKIVFGWSGCLADAAWLQRLSLAQGAANEPAKSAVGGG